LFQLANNVVVVNLYWFAKKNGGRINKLWIRSSIDLFTSLRRKLEIHGLYSIVRFKFALLMQYFKSFRVQTEDCNFYICHRFLINILFQLSKGSCSSRSLVITGFSSDTIIEFSRRNTFDVLRFVWFLNFLDYRHFWNFFGVRKLAVVVFCFRVFRLTITRWAFGASLCVEGVSFFEAFPVWRVNVFGFGSAMYFYPVFAPWNPKQGTFTIPFFIESPMLVSSMLYPILPFLLATVSASL